MTMLQIRGRLRSWPWLAVDTVDAKSLSKSLTGLNNNCENNGPSSTNNNDSNCVNNIALTVTDPELSADKCDETTVSNNNNNNNNDIECGKDSCSSENDYTVAALAVAGASQQNDEGVPERKSSDKYEDDVFVAASNSAAASVTIEESTTEETAQLSVIDEERDDSERSCSVEIREYPPAETAAVGSSDASGEASDQPTDDDGTISNQSSSAGHMRVRPRSSAPGLLTNRRQSISSIDISRSNSQLERLSTENGVSAFDTETDQICSKSPVRRGLSSTCLTAESNGTAGADGRRYRPNSDMHGEGTILVTLANAARSHLDRSMSVSTPSVDSASDGSRASVSGTEPAPPRSRSIKQHIRTPSMVVPVITPRIPLMGLLPSKVSKPADRTGDGKSKERSSGFFGSRSKRNKANDVKPHFWIKNSCSNSDCCDVCAKPLANTDAYQCNDCLLSVHLSCKSSMEKTPCLKSKHPKPVKPPQSAGPLKPSISGDVSMAAEIARSDLPLLRDGTVRHMPQQRHSVSSLSSDTLQSSLFTMTAPAALNVRTTWRSFPNGFRAFVEEPIWGDLGIWNEHAEAWSTGPGKSEKKKMSSKEVKRQDIIHELFVTEQHHCQILTVLKHTYYDGLLFTNILTADQLRSLLPGVNELTEIHYEFLRAMKQKKDSTTVVDSICDILINQFTGESAARMIEAYTHFCFQKDATVREYQRLMSGANSQNFSQFVKSITAHPFYKSRSLPDCLLLVTQRLSKYHTFVENLQKNTADDSPEKEGICMAERAVKELVMAVNTGIGKELMQETRMKICASMDPRTTTEFSVDGDVTDGPKVFTVDDLKSPVRTLVYCGDVLWQNARQKQAEVTMLLFNDVIVFLQKNGSGGYAFFRQDGKSGVFSLHKLIVRDKAGRMGSQGIYLIAQLPKPEMYDISCKSKKELAEWMSRIQRTVQTCLSQTKNEQCDGADESLLTGNEEAELQTYFKKFEAANTQLRTAFNDQAQICTSVLDYVSNLPFRSGENKSQIINMFKEYIDECTNAAQQKHDMLTMSHDAALLTTDIDGLEDEKVIMNSGVELGRSNTFHGAITSIAKRPSKLRKHSTVSGIPELEGRPRHATSQPFCSDANGVSPTVAHDSSLSLIHRLADAEMKLLELKQENLQLAAELAVAKERSRFASTLEDLRLQNAELEKQRAQFQHDSSDKTIELKCKDKALKEKEERLARQDLEIQGRWECLRSAWENQRMKGLPVGPLLPSSSGTCPDVNSLAPSSIPTPASPGSPARDSSSPVSRIQRTPVSVPEHLTGAVVLGGKVPPPKQQLSATLLSIESTSGSSLLKPRASTKDKRSSKSSMRLSDQQQIIPNKLASLTKK